MIVSTFFIFLPFEEGRVVRLTSIDNMSIDKHNSRGEGQLKLGKFYKVVY